MSVPLCTKTRKAVCELTLWVRLTTGAEDCTDAALASGWSGAAQKPGLSPAQGSWVPLLRF